MFSLHIFRGEVLLLTLVLSLLSTCSWSQEDEPESHDNITAQLHRKARSVTYKCSRNRCVNGVCRPMTYEGSNPPGWCRNLIPHRQETKCEWQRTCWSNNHCSVTSYKCDKVYEDLRGGQPKSVFNFNCNGDHCTMTRCQGGHCSNVMGVSMDKLQTFIRQFPKCEDVEGRKRKKRAPGAVQGLIDYCCEIDQTWSGTVFTLRPIRG